MANPTLRRKQEESFTPNQSAKELFKAVYDEGKGATSYGEDVALLRVSTLISKMSFYYEKIRNAVDYQEEHLLKKNAIERILKRLVVIEGTVSARDERELARSLMIDLIRAGYLPNNQIPESKVDELAPVIAKYLRFRKLALRSISGDSLLDIDIKERNALSNWVLALAASDIEERLGRRLAAKVVVKDMYATLTRLLRLPEDSSSQDDLSIQIFIGIHRSYLKFDRDMLSFILLRYYHPEWKNASDEEIAEVAANVRALQAEMDRQLEHPLSAQISKLVSRYNVYYSILLDVIESDPVGVYDSFARDPKAFPRMIKEKCAVRYKAARKKLWRAAVRSIIYILLTKGFFVALIEIPADRLLGIPVEPLILAINIAFPAALLFLAVALTGLPGDDNTAKIVKGIEEIVFVEKQRKDQIVLRGARKRGGLSSFFFGIFYFGTFLASFGAMIYGLDRIGFGWPSIVIFLFFLAFVSFFIIRIRRGPRELIVLPPRESLFGFITDFFYIPIIAVGKWLSEKFSKLNVFVIILDFIIEAPFRVFVEITEEWTRYVRERKDEIE